MYRAVAEEEASFVVQVAVVADLESGREFDAAFLDEREAACTSLTLGADETRILDLRIR